MKIAVCDLITSMSVALDYVEKELLGIASGHCRRIAYLSYRMGEEYGFSRGQCVALAQAAVLHDNALKEFIEDESTLDENMQAVPKHDEQLMTKHCIAGERNCRNLPFDPLVGEAILYHHECADGSGAFGKTAAETPLAARIVHIADMTDATWNLSQLVSERYDSVCAWVRENEGSLFDADCVRLFLRVLTPDAVENLSVGRCEEAVRELLYEEPVEIPTKDLVPFADIFARIIDYKSHFTCTHSIGIAQKARRMGEYYGWSEEIQEQLYIAGAFHDVGKLMIHNDILEKPGRLTENEYKTIQDHAKASYDILTHIRGFETIALWASLHHEKPDGSGYPFGKTASELGKKERLMACLDVYQALVEKRPYKDGMKHREAMKILYDMAAKNQLDAEITADIDRVFGSGE